MDLRPYVENIQQQLAVAADAGGEDARALAARLAAPLDAAIRLTLQEALAVAAEQITCELAPGSVELRLRGREVELVVTPPPAEPAPAEPVPGDAGLLLGDEGGTARINLRLPDHLKGRIELAAAGEGVSVNTWLVRAAAAALQRAESGRVEPRGPQGSKRFTGWAR